MSAAQQDAGSALAPPQLVVASAPRTDSTASPRPPPLAAGDGDADSDEGTQEDARCWLVARLALIALALLALRGPTAAYLHTARPCWSDAGSRTAGREYWAVLWPQYVVFSPVSLALEAWCVAVRQGFRPATPLHAWTRRFGTCAAVAAAARLAWPALDPGCRGAAGAAWQGPCRALHGASYVAAMVVPYHVLVLKLRELGLWRPARAARAALVAGAAGLVALVVAVVALFAIGLPGPSGGPVQAAFWWTGVIGLLVAFLAAPTLACCGAWSLLAAAARSGRAGMAQAARWVRGTAALVVASLLLLLTEALILAASLHNYDEGLWHAYSWGSATNNGFNCLQVALLSGLAGPRPLRRLAVRAFERINCYSPEELQR
ncbi:unnamed protein product [Prorocentrum cordatum]|uniref:Uncharacterized protein n=1 Tax=Prorocentrum cordatum TaxID=2364126 RepID=A0ABN9XRB7_9DINO|nr:unnamed protein product [Polarella glacialis]